jgi:hypothetical protein
MIIAILLLFILFILFTRENFQFLKPFTMTPTSGAEEAFVPISKENIKTPPYEDIFLRDYAVEKEHRRQDYEKDLIVNYNQENDIPINIIYDDLANSTIA